jgi:hypothetical protein
LHIKEAAELSLPATFVYLVAYVIFPSILVLADDHSFERFSFTMVIFFLYYIPFTALFLISNSSMAWLGSLLSVKLFGHKGNSDSAMVS